MGNQLVTSSLCRCGFCQVHATPEKPIYQSKVNFYICENCASGINNIFVKRKEKEGATTPSKPKIDFKLDLKPKEIKAALDEHVIGQEDAKRILSVAIFNHFKRVNYKRKNPHDPEIKKSNILLIGPTGCGKTLLAETIAKKFKIPFATADASMLTKAGYVGEDVQDMVYALVANADWDIEAAQKGIIYVDEVDKLAKGPKEYVGIDIGEVAVQQALLKIIESAKIPIKIKTSRGVETKEVDTSNILFIFGGAFVGMEKIIQERREKKEIGFGARINNKTSQLLNEIQVKDLKKYGLIPEFIGRIPVVAVLKELSEEDLVQVLVKPRDALAKQYIKLFEMDNIKLTFSKQALEAIAKKALASGSGARGTRQILEEVMKSIMYEAPSVRELKEIVVTSKSVLNGVPDYIFSEENVKIPIRA
jgi:ATP-dependent Clp protease ATP-binding subunit ClpX